MTHHSKIAAEPTRLDLELDQIEALKASLDRRAHWLRQQRAVEGSSTDTGKRLWCRYGDLADREQVDVLHSAYRLFEIDGLWTAYMDAANETWLEIYEDRAALVERGRAAMSIAREPIADPRFFGDRFGG